MNVVCSVVLPSLSEKVIIKSLPEKPVKVGNRGTIKKTGDLDKFRTEESPVYFLCVIILNFRKLISNSVPSR